MNALKLWFCQLVTQSADKFYAVVEAETEEEAIRLAEDEAIRTGDLQADDRDDPEAETYFVDPIEIAPMTGTAGVRMSAE